MEFGVKVHHVFVSRYKDFTMHRNAVFKHHKNSFASLHTVRFSHLTAFLGHIVGMCSLVNGNAIMFHHERRSARSGRSVPYHLRSNNQQLFNRKFLIAHVYEAERTSNSKRAFRDGSWKNLHLKRTLWNHIGSLFAVRWMVVLWVTKVLLKSWLACLGCEGTEAALCIILL